MISFSHNETFTVTKEGRAIAFYLADQWRQQGKCVTMHENESTITISYTTINTLATMNEFLAIGQNVSIINKEGNEQ